MRAVLTCCLAVLTAGCLVREGMAAPSKVASCSGAVQPAAPQCVEVEGKDVGMLPLEVRLGDRATVHFAEWTQADESSSDVIGFAAHLPPDVVYSVKAGDDVYTGREPRWLHPAGITGPRVHRIKAVTFCRVAPTGCAAASEPVVDSGRAAGRFGVLASR